MGYYIFFTRAHMELNTLWFNLDDVLGELLSYDVTILRDIRTSVRGLTILCVLRACPILLLALVSHIPSGLVMNMEVFIKDHGGKCRAYGNGRPSLNHSLTCSLGGRHMHAHNILLNNIFVKGLAKSGVNAR